MAQTIKGINVELGLDTEQLDAGLKKVNSNLKKQKEQLTEVNKKLKFDKNNLDLWKQKQSQLNLILEETKKKLELNKKALEDAKRNSAGISDAQFSALEKAVATTEKELNNLNKQLAETKTRISALSKQDINNIQKLGQGFTKYLTAPLVAAATALGTLTGKLAGTLDELGDNADKVKVSAEEYQKWNYAAKIMAVESNTLQRAFVKVNDMLGDIATNSFNAQESLALIGLTEEDLKGKDASKVLLMISDGLKDVGSEAEKISVINKVFGERIGSELVPLLGLTSDGIEKLFDKAEKLGIATNEQRVAAGKFTDSLVDLKQAFTALGYQISDSILPLLQNLVELLTTSIIPKISSFIDHIRNLDEGTKKMVITLIALTAAIGPFLTSVTGIIKLVNTLKVSVKSLSGVLTALSANPIILIISVVAGIILLLYTRSEKFRESINKLVDAISEIAIPIFDALSEILETLFDSLGDILAVAGDIVGDILIPVIELLQPLIDLITSFTKLLSNKLTKSLKVVFEILKPIVEFLAEALEIIEKIIKLIMEGSKLGKGFRSLFGIEDESDNINYASSTGKAITSSTANSIAQGTSQSTVDNSVNNYEIKIEANEYVTAEEVAEALAMKLQSRR